MSNQIYDQLDFIKFTQSRSRK